MPRQQQGKRSSVPGDNNFKMTNLSVHESDDNLSTSHKIVYSYEKQIKKNKNFWSNVDSLSANKLKIEDESKERIVSAEEKEKEEDEIKEHLDSVKSGESVFKVFYLLINNLSILLCKTL